MAKNTGEEFRRGAVTGRTQFQRPDGHWQKRDERTGQFISVKEDGSRYKGPLGRSAATGRLVLAPASKTGSISVRQVEETVKNISADSKKK